MATIFKRKAYQKLLQWKAQANGQSALLIQGARRVGKSTLALTFAQNEYETHLLIDFATASKSVKALFDDISDLDYFFIQLSTLCKVRLIPRRSVIIFDEVQLFPKARQAIKHLVADGRFDYIETGSLLSIKQNVKNILIPSEEYRLNLLPMDYEEFCWARGDEVTVPNIRKFFQMKRPVGDAVHRKLMRDFRLYMLIGGMPQAVDAFLRTEDLSLVDAVKRQIIDLYEDDFRKIDRTGRIAKLFDAIPSQLNANTNRYRVSQVLEGYRASSIEESLAELFDSLTVAVAYHANDPSPGLPFHKSTKNFKLFIADTGLFTTLAFKDKDFTENTIYTKLLTDNLKHTDIGYLYENIAAQILQASGQHLFYHTIKSDTSNRSYEIDFLISKGAKLIPIEVKSSNYTSHRSMDVFTEKFSGRIGARYLVYTKDYKQEQDLFMIPIYMLPFIVD